MILPRGDEYSMAVQNPGLCFSDSDLKLSTVQTNNLGIPVPYSGGFTTTYKVRSGNFSWAARCFTREIGHLQKRYQAIDEFIEKTGCDYLVEARYLKQGIQVNNDWSPIIKMHWIEGDLFNVYIGKILKRKEEIESLLKEFVSLVEKLKKDKIAHGDLQHGNIIVKNDKLFLVDYDGMFLPKIAEVGTEEIGHPNYQHPKRTVGCFDNKLDRFSSLVIYVSLKALSLKPSLWKKYNNGENILFKKEDFSDPLNSELFYDLSQIEELKHLTNNLVCVCLSDFAKIPSLDDFINDKTEFGKITINSPKSKQADNANDFFGNLYKQKTTTAGGFQYKPTLTVQNQAIKNTKINTASSGPSTPTNNPVNSPDSFSFKKLVPWIIAIGLIVLILNIFSSGSSPTSTQDTTTNNNGIDTNSTNTECYSGYVRDSAGECITRDQDCQNKNGVNSSWGVTSCVCNPGYVWNSTHDGCIVKPTLTNNQICARDIPNSYWSGKFTDSGGPLCYCNTGYLWDSSSNTCIVAPTLTNSQKCAGEFSNSYWGGEYNTTGGLTCDCLTGYYWDNNSGKGSGCFTSASLSQYCNSKYSNAQWDGGYGTNGSYECDCKSGYTWDATGSYCVAASADPQQWCKTNNPGMFSYAEVYTNGNFYCMCYASDSTINRVQLTCIKQSPN